MDEDLVEKVAVAIELADKDRIADNLYIGKNPEISDWGFYLATKAIGVMQPEIDRLRDEINILKSQLEHDAAVIERLQAELDNK